MKEEHKEHAIRIGKNILNLLIMYEKEQKDLAEYLGVGEGTVSRWIHGERTPRMGTIDRISKFFNVPRSAVLTDPAYQYYDDETVQIVTDRLRKNPEYSVLFKASANVRPEDIDLVATKTEMSERVIHMRPELLALVKSILLRQKQICLAYGVRSALLFPWRDGGPMHYEAYSKYFREHVTKIHGSPLPVHSLRHTYTSLMAEAGVPIETISRQLGHADSSITKQIYMHVTDKVREADNRRLDLVQIL